MVFLEILLFADSMRFFHGSLQGTFPPIRESQSSAIPTDSQAEGSPASSGNDHRGHRLARELFPRTRPLRRKFVIHFKHIA